MAVGKSGALPPFMSAWAANFLFGALCVLFFDRANS
jgi:lipopolysaccharide export LptBFGC system permease protein LptF